MRTALFVTLAVVVVVMLIEGFRGRVRSTSLSAYFLMNGQLRLGPFVGTLAATNFSLGNMIFLCLLWGYFYGLGGMFWLVVGFAIAAYVYVKFINGNPSVQEYIADSSNAGSVHEYLERRFASESIAAARSIRLLASATTILCLLIALTLELYLAAQLLSPLLDFDPTTVFIAITALICVYSAIGGFWAVVSTDVIQGIIILLGIIALIIILIQLDLPLANYSSMYGAGLIGTLLAPKWTGILSILGVTFAWYIVTMDTWQRACASRSPRTSASGMLLGTIALIVGIITYCLVGMYDALAVLPSLTPVEVQAHSGGLNPINDLMLLEPRLSVWGTALLGFTVVSLLMAAMSTADTFLIVCSHSLVSDLILGIARRSTFAQLTKAEDALFTGIARTVVVGLGIVIVVSYFILRSLGLLENPLVLFYLAYSIQFALLAPVMSSVMKRRPPATAVLAGLGSGVAVAVAWGFGFAIASQRGVETVAGLATTDLVYLAPIPPIIVGFLVTFSLSLLRSAPKGELT